MTKDEVIKGLLVIDELFSKKEAHDIITEAIRLLKEDKPIQLQGKFIEKGTITKDKDGNEIWIKPQEKKIEGLKLLPPKEDNLGVAIGKEIVRIVNKINEIITELNKRGKNIL